MSMGPPANFEKAPWYSLGKLHLALLILFFLVFLMIVPGWGIAGLVTRFRKKERVRGIPDKWTRQFAVLLSSFNLMFLIGLPMALAIAGEEIVVRVPRIIKMLPVIPLLSVILWLMLIYSGTRSRKLLWKLSGRIQYALLAITSYLFFWLLNFYKLLGFHF